MDFIYDRNKTAIVYKEKEYSYKDLLIALKYYASLFKVKSQDKIVLFMENRPELMFTLFAGWELECMDIVLDAAYSTEQLLYVLNDATPEYIVTSNKNIKTAQAAKDEYGKPLEIINVDDITIPSDYVPNNMILNVKDREKIAVLLYTSGTTGNPKGVMLTYNNLLSVSDSVKEINILSEKDRFLALLPFHHVLPLNITLILPIYFGTYVVILDELNSEHLKKALKDNQITVIIGVPRVMELLHKGIMSKINAHFITRKLFALCKKINNFKLNRLIFKSVYNQLGGALRLCVSGGARLDPQIAQDLYTLSLPIVEGYGLTETSPLISFNRPDNIHIGTVGEPIPHVIVKVAEDGELLAKGPNVMKGYYNLPEATAEIIDKDGWFHTGDLATFENNFITIIGRKKEMIVLSNGKNINPIEIEDEIMRGSSLIKEIAVIDNEDHLIAVVYPDFDMVKHKQIVNIKETLKWEIIDKYNITAPKYRKILEIKIVKDELPKTRLGKIRRFMLKDFLKSHTMDTGSESAQEIAQEQKKEIEIPSDVKEEYDTIKENIETNYNVKVTPDAHLELDLELDSLDMMEILAFIESNFGVKIPEEELVNIKNVLDLATYVKNHGGSYSEKNMDMNAILNEDIDAPLPGYPYIGKILLLLLWPLFALYFRIKKLDTDKIPKESAIYSGNHQSFLDPVFLIMSLPFNKINDTYFLAINVHFNSAIKRFIARHSNIIIININKNLKESLQMSAKVLKNKKNLVIFPEGARTRDGELQEFKKTFAILSHDLNVPIVPFGLKGAYEAMPFGVSIPRPKQVTVKFFDKIEPEGKSIGELVALTKETIKEWYDNIRNKNGN